MVKKGILEAATRCVVTNGTKISPAIPRLPTAKMGLALIMVELEQIVRDSLRASAITLSFRVL
jgi:hypothetical protein